MERTQGGDSGPDQLDAVMAIPANDAFWALTIGDPGPMGLFQAPIYDRGAATLQALRVELGDEAFFAACAGVAGALR